MRPALLRLGEVPVDRRVVADHGAGERGRVENLLQGVRVLVNPEEQHASLLREERPHAVQTPTRLVGVHHQRVGQQGAEDLELVVPVTRQLAEQRVGLRLAQLQMLEEVEHETDFVEGEADDVRANALNCLRFSDVHSFTAWPDHRSTAPRF